ncbi:MAG TPA: SusC/RagA family TonB-linked outer membrane protein [Prolixibacteraceae bacterium]|nr:SusC/RagA family TonB-linked outer membrane protein [Prolixibacteraceae bacterium]
MRNKQIRNILMLVPFFGALALNAQNGNEMEQVKLNNPNNETIKEKVIDYGLMSEKTWRSTSASYTIRGEELERMTSGNLLNTLQGRIPGLTVMTGSGEPGYDNPNLIGRGLSSWNLTGNNLLIYLDGYQVNLSAISSLSAHEIETVTFLKDAASLAIYGMEGGSGVLSIKTKRGIDGETQIIANGRYGVQSVIDLPSVMNAYDYTRLYNQARQNDGLTARYANPELYKNGGDPAHPDVNWYDEVLQPYSYIQDYNLSFRGGGENARYFVLMDYSNFTGMYKNASERSKDFGTNAEYTRFNMRGNVDVDITKSLSVSAQISGIVEDKNTPSGFTASKLFSNLMDIPAAAFSVENPDGSWGNNTIYNFNPVMLLKTGGVYNAHTRNIQTNFSFNQKLDQLVKGLSLVGGISFSNQYIGFTNKSFTNLSYELLKDKTDSPLIDPEGKYRYAEIGSISDNISDGEVSHWNRQTSQVGFNYDQRFGEHTFTGALLAKRNSLTHNGLIYENRNQGLLLNATYDYAKTYIASLSAGYTGSADFEKGSRYGLFPSLALGWIVSNENFMKDKPAFNFLKIRTSIGLTGNTNSNNRFLYEQWSTSHSGWNFTNSNTWYSGRREGAIPNHDFRWEQKATANIGVDAELLGKLSLNLDFFTEKRTGILENASSQFPNYAGFRLANLNTGEVQNSGFEAIIGFNDNVGDFEYYFKGMASFAQNKILKISEVIQPHDWLYSKGYSINQNRILVNDGFYQGNDFNAEGLVKEGVVASSFGNPVPGDLKYIDQNKDGVINDYDFVPFGYNNMPEFTFGFNLGFKYKRFDLDAFFQGVTNRTVILPFEYTHPFVNNNNITAFSENAWTPETASTATSPRLSTQLNFNTQVNTDFYARDGSFIKLRSLELGYSTKIGKIENVRIYFNGTNLFTWDKIDDLEAERLSSGYPLMKSLSLGLKVNF